MNEVRAIQQWEYLETIVKTRGFGPPVLIVHEVNGQTALRDAGKKGREFLIFYEFANELGKEGWEMCGVIGSTEVFRAFFRRSLT